MYFLILHIMFGQDFGFGNLFKKKTASLLKYYSTILTLMSFAILMWPFKIGYQEVWYWCTIIHCVFNFCILKTAKYSVYNFLFDMHAAERIVVLEKETFGVLISVYALTMFIAKDIIFAIFCMFDLNLYCQFNHFYFAFYAICCHAVDLMHETQIVVYFYIYAYVKNMKRCLEDDRDINKLVERYDKIFDCQDKIRRLRDYFVSI